MDHEEVFISYKRENPELRNWVVGVLKHLGVSAWYDGAMGSGSWKAQIVEKIEACRAVVLIWTADTAQSRPCANEIGIAAAEGKTIIPLFFEYHPLTTAFKWDLTELQGVEYCKGPIQDRHLELRRMLFQARVRVNPDADLAVIPPIPAIRRAKPLEPQPEFESVEKVQTAEADPKAKAESVQPEGLRKAPPSDRVPEIIGKILQQGGCFRLHKLGEWGAVDAAIDQFFSVRIEGERWTKLKTELLALASERVLENQFQQRVLELLRAHGPEGLLLAGQFDRAAAACNEQLRNELSFETMRWATVANLAEACNTERTAFPEARAAMCLAVLENTPDLWSQWQGNKGAIERVLAAAWRILDKLSTQQPTTHRDEDLTGGLCVAEFIQAERDSAHRIAQLGRRMIDTGRGRICLAFGYGFAKEFGRRWQLEERGQELAPIQKELFF